MKEGMDEMGASIRKDMSLTFGAAYALIVYEVCLSRFFSALFENHAVFIAITLATLGIGIGGYLSSRTPGDLYRLRSEWLGGFSLVLVVVVLIMYGMPYFGIWYYSAMAILPFLVGGMLISCVMQNRHLEVSVLYFSDLAGAGLGAVSAIPLMNLTSPLQTIFLLSASLFAMSLFTRANKSSFRKSAVYFLLLFFLLYNAILPITEQLPFRSYRTSPSNVFMAEKNIRIVFSDWNAFSKTDVYDAGDGQLLYITIDGGAMSPISKYSGDLNLVDYLKNTTSYLAFQLFSKERALIIGAGGGQEVLAAQLAGFQKIEAVDINSGSFNAVKELSAFSGDVFHQPNVRAVISDGRSYIRQSRQQYDVIYLSLVKKKSENGFGIALSENYLFTQEAITAYLAKLNPGGKLAFLLHNEKELAKVKKATENALLSQGIPSTQMQNHLAVIGTYQHLGHVVWGMGGSLITRPLVLIGTEPFTTSDAHRLKDEAKHIQQIPVHIPYVQDRYRLLTNTLEEHQLNKISSRDDKPYFYLMSSGVPQAFVWLLLAILSMVTMIVRKTNYAHGRAVYFSGIAIGFILIETTLIQRLILTLGHPTYAFVLVLGILLVSGGIGSFVSGKWRKGTTRRFHSLICIAIYALGVNSAITWYNDQLISLPMPVRLIVVGILLVPLGFFMGMPFPIGLSRIPPRIIAISWAINGLMTVVGSLLTVMISMTIGFSATLAIGAAIYGLLYGIQPQLGMQNPETG